MTGGIGKRSRSENCKEIPNSKRQQLEKHDPNWSALHIDIVECIIGRSHWADRIRIRAVCKAWSIPIRHIPTINDVPWAMEFIWKPINNNQVSDVMYGECRLCDPFSRDYVVEEPVEEEESQIFLPAIPIPCASVYGWVLFKVFELKEEQFSLFLYSPFTTEVINLPSLDEPVAFQVATFSLNATSSKCVVFLLLTYYHDHIRRICVKLCSPGDNSWKNFVFNNGFEDQLSCAVNAAYANGVFYCVFSRGELGAFDIEREEWEILADYLPISDLFSDNIHLIVSDRDLLLLDETDSKSLKLFKFDFSERRWVYENNLNYHVLFIGCTSFYAPAVGETSQLAKTIFHCIHGHRFVSCYGGRGTSLLYRRCVEATESAMCWIELPLGGIWRANDLINVV